MRDIDNNFYIKMLDGTEHEFKITDWSKLSPESKTNLEKGILDGKAFDEILTALGLFEAKKNILEIEIPKCVKLLEGNPRLFEAPNLIGIKIHNDKIKILMGAIGYFTPSLTRSEQEIPHLYRWWDELR